MNMNMNMFMHMHIRRYLNIHIAMYEKGHPLPIQMDNNTIIQCPVPSGRDLRDARSIIEGHRPPSSTHKEHRTWGMENRTHYIRRQERLSDPRVSLRRFWF